MAEQTEEFSRACQKVHLYLVRLYGLNGVDALGEEAHRIRHGDRTLEIRVGLVGDEPVVFVQAHTGLDVSRNPASQRWLLELNAQEVSLGSLGVNRVGCLVVSYSIPAALAHCDVMKVVLAAVADLADSVADRFSDRIHRSQMESLVNRQ